MGKSRITSLQGRCRVKRLRAALFFGLLAIAFLFAGFAFFIRIGLTGDHVARMFIPHLERASGWNVSISTTALAWPSLQRIRLTFNDLKCRDRLDGRVRFHVPRADLEVSLLPLLRGILRIDETRLSEPTVCLHQVEIPTREQVSSRIELVGHGRFFLYPVIGTLELESGRVMLGPVTLLDNVQITGENLSIRGAANFVARGIVERQGNPGRFELAGRIDETPLLGGEWQGQIHARLAGCPLSVIDALASQLGHKLPTAEGTLSMSLDAEGRTKDCRIKGEAVLSHATLLPGQLFLQPVLVENASFRFTGDLRNDGLTVHLRQISVPGIDLSAELKVNNLWSDDAGLTLAVRNAELHLEKLFPLIPMTLFREADRQRIAAAGLRGHVMVTGAAWTGKVADIWRESVRKGGCGDLVFDADLESVSGFVPGYGLQVKDASGRIRLNPDEMRFQEISLTLGTSPIVLNGAVSNLRTAPQVDLFVSMQALAQDLDWILQNRAIADQLPPWLKSVQEPRGGITVRLDMKGSASRPKMAGHIALDQFQCRFEGLPLPVKGFKGSLRFDKAGATLANLNGFIGDTPAQLVGSVSSDSMRLDIEAKVVPNDLKRLNLLPQTWNLVGKIPVSLDLDGNPSKPRFSAHVDLKGNRVQIRSVVDKKVGIPLAVEASGFRDSDGITIEEAYILIDKSRIAAKGTVENSGKAIFTINLPPTGIQTKDLVPLADPVLQLQPGGRLEGDAIVKAGPDWSRNLTLDANLVLNHVSLNLGFRKPVDGMTGKLRWRGETVDATLERAKIGSSLFSGACSITGWKNPRVEVHLLSSFLDTTDFTAPSGRVSHVTWGEWIRENPVIRFLARSHGIGILKAEKGKTAVRAFSDFQANVEGNNGILKAPQWKMKFAEGTLRGNALFDIKANTKKPLELEFQGDNLKMQRILVDDPEKVSLEGSLLVEGHLQWNTTAKKENNGIYKTGAMEVRLRDGTIHRFEILSKIFSLINLGSIVSGRLPDIAGQGLPFSRLTWDMEVFDSKWKVKNLKLVSDAAHIEAAGMYFSDQERVDFTVDVSPLVGIDTIFSGLFGNLITKDGKTLTTTFRVRGLATSPDVRLEPLESVSAR